eukprot:TRINITY_DN11940_c0_g1_i1.p1 TRINITY_DN11940_c0_g1~~TRINITY_DN11940_c0_g1_i1.p1  ORF type:complete len:1259 (+),score=300.12 TRINITY_DN11940_c0_g1_i1:94-3870(+)
MQDQAVPGSSSESAAHRTSATSHQRDVSFVTPWGKDESPFATGSDPPGSAQFRSHRGSRRSTSAVSVVGMQSDLRDHSGLMPLSPEEDELYKQLFGQLDAAMDGYVAVLDLWTACRLLQVQFHGSRPEMEALIDTNQDGQVSLQEFLNFMRVCKTKGMIQWNPEKVRWVILQVQNQNLMNEQSDLRRHNVIRQAAAAGSRDVRVNWLCDTMGLITGCYYGGIVPMEWAMKDNDMFWQDRNVGLLVGECVISLFAVGDIMLGYRNVKTTNVQSLSTPLSRYLASSTFVLNVLAGLPVDLIAYATDLPVLHSIGRVARLASLDKLQKLFRLGDSTLVTVDSSRWVYETAPIVRSAIWSLLVINLATCLFMLAAPCSGTEEEPCPSTPQQYLAAIYWALYTLSTVGYGDISVPTDESKVLACFMFALSVVVNGYLVGKITSLMMVDPSGEHREMMAKTRQTLSQFAMPIDMREDILSLQNHFLNMKLSLQSFKTVVHSLPGVVHESLSLYIRVQQLTQIPLFLNVSAACQVTLAEALVSQVYARDEFLTVEGCCAEAMYFVTHGFCEVTKDDEPLGTLTRGAFFGEGPLVAEEITYTVSTRTLTYTELLILSKGDFETITGKFPMLKWQIEVVHARKRGLPPPPMPTGEDGGGAAGATVGNVIEHELRRRRVAVKLRDDQADQDQEEDFSLDSSINGPLPVRFFGFAGEWGQLCSFWPSEFEVGGLTFRSVEHYFQSMKFEGTPHMDEVRLSSTPEEARAKGKDRSRPLRTDWDQVRETVMLQGLRAKFSQCKNCYEVLMRTGSRKLLFCDSADDYWGIGPAGTGKNTLGEMLMLVRKELEEHGSTEVTFNGYTEPWGKLSIDWPSQFAARGRNWPTLQHFFQAMKWQGTSREELIAAAPTPEAAREIGMQTAEGEQPRPDWDEMACEYMLEGMRAKFTQDAQCRAELLRTGFATITHSNPDEEYWGSGTNGVGLNMLGTLLMQVRDELFSTDAMPDRILSWAGNTSVVTPSYEIQSGSEFRGQLLNNSGMGVMEDGSRAVSTPNAPVDRPLRAAHGGGRTTSRAAPTVAVPGQISTPVAAQDDMVERSRTGSQGSGAGGQDVEAVPIPPKQRSIASPTHAIGSRHPSQVPAFPGVSAVSQPDPGVTAVLGEMMSQILQMRETQLQQQEFLRSAVDTILGNQKIMTRRLMKERGAADAAPSQPPGGQLGLGMQANILVPPADARRRVSTARRASNVLGRSMAPVGLGAAGQDADFHHLFSS